jgi:hypothetical protein
MNASHSRSLTASPRSSRAATGSPLATPASSAAIRRSIDNACSSRSSRCSICATIRASAAQLILSERPGPRRISRRGRSDSGTLLERLDHTIGNGALSQKMFCIPRCPRDEQRARDCQKFGAAAQASIETNAGSAVYDCAGRAGPSSSSRWQRSHRTSAGWPSSSHGRLRCPPHVWHKHQVTLYQRSPLTTTALTERVTA